MTFCHACTAPLQNPEFRGASDIYCKYCSDEKGNLKPYEEVKAGIVQWIKDWQGVSDDVAAERAEYFMKAMPAWADR
jgi:LSD1 subclass zinc finger protein